MFLALGTTAWVALALLAGVEAVIVVDGGLVDMAGSWVVEMSLKMTGRGYSFVDK